MTEKDPTSNNPERDGGESGRESYEAPRLISVGNARDILAGNAGSRADAPACPFNPTRHVP
jgi:hypothetical protein